MTLSAGKLRHRVRLQEQQTVQNPNTGAVKTEWADVASVWAAIEPLSAREFIEAAATQASVTARITIRYRPGVRPTMRIRHGGKIYGIEGVLSDKESGREYLTLPCSEGPSEGL